MGEWVLRAAAFLGGLLGLRAAEMVEPHHAPTAPLRLRWIANLGFGVVNGLLVSVLFAALALPGAWSLAPRAGTPLGRILPNVWARIFVLVGIPAAGLVAFEVVFLAAAQFQHANVRIPARLESVFWRTLVPPAMHRIHHAPHRPDTDSNCGTLLTAWDRMFGSFNRRAPDEAPAFGLPGLRDPDRLGPRVLALLPFRRQPAA